MALTNNDILKKLRVALKFRDEDIIEVLSLVNYQISKSELGAFFRKEDHPKFKELQDQILRNFLNGLIIYNRGTMDIKKVSEKTSDNMEPVEKKQDVKKADNKNYKKRNFGQKTGDKKKFESKMSNKRKPRPRFDKK